MPLSIESEIDLLYHLSTMSEHVLPKGIFYLLLWKRLNQASIPPAFTFNEMVDHLRTLFVQLFIIHKTIALFFF